MIMSASYMQTTKHVRCLLVGESGDEYMEVIHAVQIINEFLSDRICQSRKRFALVRLRLYLNTSVDNTWYTHCDLSPHL